MAQSGSPSLLSFGLPFAQTGFWAPNGSKEPALIYSADLSRKSRTNTVIDIRKDIEPKWLDQHRHAAFEARHLDATTAFP
jgi:hypothetical protein